MPLGAVLYRAIQAIGGFGLRGLPIASSQASGFAFPVALPAHQAGDVIVVFVSGERTDGNGNLACDNTAWNPIAGASEGVAGGINTACFVRKVTGSGATLEVDNSKHDGEVSAIAYVVRGAHGDAAALTSNNKNPPALTPAWGSAKNLWLVCYANRPATAATAPAGFSGIVNNTVRAAAGIAAAIRIEEAATLDPGNFGGGGGTGIAMAVAVRPA